MEAAGMPFRVAADNAAFHGARARTFARTYGVDPVTLLQRRTVRRATEEDVRGMREERNTVLEQAMQRSEAKNIDNFIEEAQNGKLVFHIEEQEPVKLQNFFGIDDLIVNIPCNFVQHLYNRRPQQAEKLIHNLAKNLAYADMIVETGREKTGQKRYTAVKYEGNTATVVIFCIYKSKKKGNRAIPITSFTGPKEAIDSMVVRKNRAATSLDVGGVSNMPKPLSEDEIQVLTALDEEISTPEAHVNDKKQSFRQPNREAAPVPQPPLMVMHNLHPNQLAEVLRLGGLPSPSLGVPNAHVPYGHFGPIP